MDILGIHIPFIAPLFLAVLAVHIPLGLAAVICGIVAMFSKKRPGRHPRFGSIYYWSMAGIFATMTVLSIMRWSHDDHLFVLGALAFTAATVGRTAHRRRWRGWVRVHITGMGISYILLLTAFYVDNGKSLPLWKELPTIAYWLLPGAIGLPLIVNALWRHPLVRPSSRTTRAHTALNS